jgi:aerobic carbon-monoxide dehydrogenase large subunit
MGGRWVGRRLRRVEDPRHLVGSASFVDDMRPVGLRHVAFVRSPFASASIGEIDPAPALELDGVEAVLVRGDLGELRPLTPLLRRPEFVPLEVPLLPSDRARHVGEPLALVVAATPHAAEDGAERVRVDYDEDPAVASLDAALADGAPRVHAAAEGNVLLDVAFADHPELDAAFAGAELVVEATFATARVSALPLEGRGCLAHWDAREGRLHLHTSTQVPHIVRTTVAGALGIPERCIRVVAPDVGGGFGQKCVVAREEIILGAAARALGIPLKWVEDRQESLVAGFQGHEQRYDVRAAFDPDGRMLALDADVLCDVGAYSCHPFTCGVEPLMAATELLGSYDVERYRCRTRAVATHKTPMAPYRGVSRPQIVLVMERLMEKAAAHLALDPLEVRRRNLIAEFPHTHPTGLVVDEGSYRESLERCAEALGWADWRERQEAARREGRLLGLGFACFGERTGYGSEAFSQRKMDVTPGYDIAHLRMDPTGGITLLVGTCGHGQGHLTTLAQIAADELGVDPGRIEVRQGDTDSTPYGWGTFASRSMVVGGGATKLACQRLADRLKRLAAHLLEAAVEDLELVEGAARVRGVPDREVAFEELGRVAYLESRRLPPGDEPGLEAQASYDPPGTFSNATHGAEIEIDHETGAVSIRRYVVVEDCGVVINPTIVDGQVRGGVAQGIAAALYERLAFTEEGQPQSTSLMDYLVPTAAEIPDLEIHHLETPSEHSVTGAKGMGEGGTIGAPACIASAVTNAVAHLGIEVDELPVSPETLQAAIAAARPAERSAA